MTKKCGPGADGDSFYEYLLKARAFIFFLVVSAAGRYEIVMFLYCLGRNRKCQVWLQGGKREDEKFLKGAHCFFDDSVSSEFESRFLLDKLFTEFFRLQG